eukprot:3829841-Alexandrium_andersonii.AAC.1
MSAPPRQACASTALPVPAPSAKAAAAGVESRRWWGGRASCRRWRHCGRVRAGAAWSGLHGRGKE